MGKARAKKMDRDFGSCIESTVVVRGKEYMRVTWKGTGRRDYRVRVDNGLHRWRELPTTASAVRRSIDEAIGQPTNGS
jgi:hypothetical protein